MTYGEHEGHALQFLGLLFFLLGVSAFLGTYFENRKVPQRVWDRSELLCYYGGLIGAALGFLFLNFGCGGRPPEPTDQVTVEVVACEPTLGGTAGQYYRLAEWREEVGICEAAMSEDSARQAARDAAERDVGRLGVEFDVYRAAGRTDCYCGPVCQEMTGFLEGARQNGLFCRGP